MLSFTGRFALFWFSPNRVVTQVASGFHRVHCEPHVHSLRRAHTRGKPQRVRACSLIRSSLGLTLSLLQQMDPCLKRMASNLTHWKDVVAREMADAPLGSGNSPQLEKRTPSSQRRRTPSRRNGSASEKKRTPRRVMTVLNETTSSPRKPTREDIQNALDSFDADEEVFV